MSNTNTEKKEAERHIIRFIEPDKNIMCRSLTCLFCNEISFWHKSQVVEKGFRFAWCSVCHCWTLHEQAPKNPDCKKCQKLKSLEGIFY